MRIAKFGHSCLLVEAASGARIIVDPGNYSSVPDSVVADRIDAVLVTHAHPDHCDDGLLGRIEAAHPGIAIHASSDIVAMLAGKGIKATNHELKDFAVGETRVEVLEAGHEAILGVPPVNAAYRIDGELVVTGDSGANALDAWAGTRVLALPVIAPWTTEVIQAALLKRMKPEVFFGVHDGFVIGGYRDKLEERFEAIAAGDGMRFIRLSEEPGLV